MRRESARSKLPKVKSFSHDMLYRISWKDGTPRLCLEVGEDYARYITVAQSYEYDDDWYIAVMMETDTGAYVKRDIYPVGNGSALIPIIGFMIAKVSMNAFAEFMYSLEIEEDETNIFKDFVDLVKECLDEEGE